MSKNCYIVSSAIATDTTQGDETVDRWLATLHTCDSILSRDDADIFILDTGSARLPDWIKKWWPKNTTMLDWQSEKRVHEIRQESRAYGEELSKKYKIGDNDREFVKRFIWTAYVKSATECWAIKKFLNENDLSKYNKVFKVSGRYVLNGEFKPENYKGKWTFKKQAELKDGTVNLSSVMWGFDGKHFEEFKQKWNDTYNWMMYSWKTNGSVRDLESSFWHGFGQTDEERQFTIIEKLGVMGKVNSTDGKLTIVNQ